MHRSIYHGPFGTLQRIRFRVFSISAIQRMTGYSEVNYVAEDTDETFSFSTIQKNINPLKAMLKNNPSDLEKNNARRSLCTMSKLFLSARPGPIYNEPIEANTVSLILYGIFHTSNLPTPTLGNNKPAIDLSPIFGYLEKNFWLTRCSHWTPTELSVVLKICMKINSVSVVSILASLIRPIIKIGPRLKAHEVVLVARCFHTFGIMHPRLHSMIMQLAKELNDNLSADDLNRILVTVIDEGNRDDISKLLKTLIAKATKNVKTLSPSTVSRCVGILVKCGNKFPLMKAELKSTIEEFQDLLYARAIETVACAPVSDAIEICANFSQVVDKERFSQLFKLTSERVIALSQSLKPKYIAMLFRACAQQQLLDENLFNVLAEKCCVQLTTFDEAEIANVIESLASFDLYDAELFTMVAARFAQQTREREVLDPVQINRVLRSFAKLKEKNDALLFACAQQYAISLYNLSKTVTKDALSSLKQFDFNHRDILVQLEGRLASLE